MLPVAQSNPGSAKGNVVGDHDIRERPPVTGSDRDPSLPQPELRMRDERLGRASADGGEPSKRAKRRRKKRRGSAGAMQGNGAIGAQSGSNAEPVTSGREDESLAGAHSGAGTGTSSVPQAQLRATGPHADQPRGRAARRGRKRGRGGNRADSVRTADNALADIALRDSTIVLDHGAGALHEPDGFGGLSVGDTAAGVSAAAVQVKNHASRGQRRGRGKGRQVQGRRNTGRPDVAAEPVAVPEARPDSRGANERQPAGISKGHGPDIRPAGPHSGGDGQGTREHSRAFATNLHESGRDQPREGEIARAEEPNHGPAGSGVSHARAPRRSAERLYAALDLGTNNCRLLIAAPGKAGRMRIVDAFSRIVRLGEGLSRTGRLSDEAMERALEALEICATKLRGRKISGFRLIATEACRSAENGAYFLDSVRERTGLKLEIIDRRTEARLAVAGCSPLIGRDAEAVVLFDIGGGSSEIALVDLTKRRTSKLAEHIVAWTSLPLGVVTLAERFGGKDVTPEVFEAMVEEVATHLAAFEGADKLAHMAENPRFHLLGTSGTVTTLAGVHLDLPRYDRRRVDGLWLESENIDRMIERILGWSYEERKLNPCIGAERADLVLAGCAILEAIRRRWPAERLRVADRGLREGMLNEMMARDGVWRRRRQAQGQPGNQAKAHEKTDGSAGT